MLSVVNITFLPEFVYLKCEITIFTSFLFRHVQPMNIVKVVVVVSCCCDNANILSTLDSFFRDKIFKA